MLTPEQQALCHTLLARDDRTRARLATHPHFAVLRDAIEHGAVAVIPDACTAALCETPDGPLLLPVSDHVQLPIVARYGGFQRDDLLQVVDLLRKRGRLEGGLFIDVGANVGTQTLCALGEGGFARALAVEPLPLNHRLLTYNMRLNGLADRVEIVRAALGDHEGTVGLIVNPDNCGDCRIEPAIEGPQHFDEDAFERAWAPLTTFDRLVEGIDPADIGLVWMDTQGSEGRILAASQVLAQRPIPLYVEFWPYGMAALGTYPLFKDFVGAHCSQLAWFEGRKLHEGGPEDLDALYASLEPDDRFIDLLLIR